VDRPLPANVGGGSYPCLARRLRAAMIFFFRRTLGFS
jgi:hypothetical protein